MLFIPRRAPKLYTGFNVILGDGTPEHIERRRFNGFKILDDTDDEVDINQDKQFDIEKTEKRKGNDGLPTAPAKRIK